MVRRERVKEDSGIIRRKPFKYRAYADILAAHKLKVGLADMSWRRLSFCLPF
jgi:hypothetical protein